MSILNSNGTKLTLLNHNVTKLLESEYLGDVEIFGEQIACATEVVSRLDLNNIDTFGLFKFPIVIAQAQQGKFGVILKIIDLLKKQWARQKVQGYVVVLCNVSDNSLTEQANERIMNAGLTKLVSCFHLKSRKNLARIVAMRTERPNDRLVIINDEAHVAQNSGGLFEKFMNELGVTYGVSLPKNVGVVSVTATPYGHEVTGRLKEESTGTRSCFGYISLDMNSNYFSLERLRNKGRLAQSESVTEMKTFMVRNKEVQREVLSDFMFDRLTDFKQLCDANPGYMVLRASTVAEARKIAELCSKEWVDCTIFSSATDNTRSKAYESYTIKILSKKLGIRPENPHILIIIQGGRVGVTFSTTRYIRMWIDTPSSAGDTTVQAVGRNMGYDDREYATLKGVSVHPKENDTYMVYCNMEQIDSAINFYADPYKNAVPSGTQNKPTGATGNVTRSEGRMLILKAKTNKEVVKELEGMLNHPKVYPQLLALDPLDYGVHTKHKFSVICGAVSNNISNPIARDLADFSTRANVTSQGRDTGTGIPRHVRVRLVDKCPIVDKDKHQNLKGIKGRRMSVDTLQTFHTDNWNRLMKQVPGIEGKYVYILSDAEYEVLTKMALLNNRVIKYVVLPMPANKKNKQTVEQVLEVSKRSTFQNMLTLHSGTPALA